MAISELISMAAYCVGRLGPLAGSTSTLCQWQGAFEQIGDLSSILLTGCIALDLLLIMFFGYSVSQVRRLHFRVYAPACISISLLIALVPLHIHSNNGKPFYDSSDIWCWISESYSLYQLLLFYVPLWLIFIFNTFVYLAVGRHVWKHFTSSNARAHSEETERYKYTYLKNVSFYLIVFALAWTPPSINRLYRYFHPDNQIFILYLLHATLPTANGIFNGIVYFYITWISGVLSPNHACTITTQASSVQYCHLTGIGNSVHNRNLQRFRAPEDNSYFTTLKDANSPITSPHETTAFNSITKPTSPPPPIVVTVNDYPPHFPFS
ncbi:hypothetical protein BDF19DRAFT_177836 [Syncephalis fuscata]|nr:hypothetical protein BDF19DRAFT_177836 [Syncephalis fuscata]